MTLLNTELSISPIYRRGNFSSRRYRTATWQATRCIEREISNWSTLLLCRNFYSPPASIMAHPTLKALRDNGIQNFTTLKHIGGLKAFVCRFAPHPAYSALTSRILEQQYHPLQEKLLKRYTSRTDPLWWSCLSFKTAGKRVVRSWLARRLRICFVEALKKEGFHRDGNRLNDQKPPLHGTVQLSPNTSMVDMSNEELQKEADLAVKYIMRICNKSKDGSAAKTTGKVKRDHVSPNELPKKDKARSFKISYKKM